MELPLLDGVIDRRILVNYRVRPELVKALLPSHLEPLVINGYASAGICLLRLKNIGMKYTPSLLRITSENSAHRFLVTYRDGDRRGQGVYIPRRDTDSMLNVWLTGKIFSWPHYPATFAVAEKEGRYSVTMQSEDRAISLHVSAEKTTVFPVDSMFGSLDYASSCFQNCPVGISPSAIPNQFKNLHLKTKTWTASALRILTLQSSFFSDTSLFPKDSIQFDNAMLMEGIEHEWRRAVVGA